MAIAYTGRTHIKNVEKLRFAFLDPEISRDALLGTILARSNVAELQKKFITNY